SYVSRQGLRQPSTSGCGMHRGKKYRGALTTTDRQLFRMSIARIPDGCRARTPFRAVRGSRRRAIPTSEVSSEVQISSKSYCDTWRGSPAARLGARLGALYIRHPCPGIHLEPRLATGYA